MALVEYFRDPGYFLDLCYPYLLRFNQEHYAHLDDPDDQEELGRRRALIKSFGSFDERLYPFFYLKSESESFLTHYLYQADFYHFTYESVLEKMQNQKDFIRRFMSFYFDVSEPYESFGPEDLASLTDHLDVPIELKYRIIQFFVAPGDTISRLVDSLKNSELVLRRIYAQRAKEQEMLLDDMDPAYLAQCLTNKVRRETFEASQIKGCTLTFLIKNVVRASTRNHAVFLFLGCEYKKHLELELQSDILPTLDSFGKILSETNRVRVLELLLEKGPLCTAEIAELMELSPTVMYYHLEMMHSAGMLTAKNSGRTMYYSVNRQYFEQVKEAVAKFARHN